MIGSSHILNSKHMVIWILSLLLLCFSSPVAAHNGKVALAYPIEGIVIDGDPTDWPEHLTEYPIATPGWGMPVRDEEDFRGTFRLGYNAEENTLYIVLEIEDESTVIDTTAKARRYASDGCEVYVDAIHKVEGSPAVEYAVWGNSRRRTESRPDVVDWQDAELGVKRKGRHHVYEWQIDVGALSTEKIRLGPGTVLGFDVTVCDVDEDAPRRFSRMSWGSGESKVKITKNRGDVLLVGRNQALGIVHGQVTWKDAEARTPPQSVKIQSLDSNKLRIISETNGQGVYAAKVPEGTYRIETVDFRLEDGETVVVEVKSGVENEAETLAVKRTIPADFYRPVLTSGEKDFQRGVSWVAFSDSTTEYDLLPLVRNHVNWIVQTPFSWQRDFNSTTIRLSTRIERVGWGESDTGIEGTAELARKFGIKTLLKPHLWLINRRDGKWRGEIRMDDESAWLEWFRNYEAFILHYARLAEKSGIEALCIGTELHTSAVERERDWRRIISSVRQVYGGKLVYAANWHKEFEEVPFWDALDFIGIQAYFPLTKKKNPTVEELVSGWQAHVAAIERVQLNVQKPVLITEIGYHSRVGAAIKPWEWAPRPWEQKKANTRWTDQEDLQTQANCYEAFFQTFWEKEWFGGVYFWKWYPDYQEAGGRFDKDFTPQNKPAEEVMRKWYAKAVRRVR